MSTLRFTIFALLVVTLGIALACAALVNANAWWWSGVYTISFLSLIVSCVTAIFARGETRAFAVGVVLTTPIYAYHFAAPYLITDQLLTLIRETLWVAAPPSADYIEHFTLIWHTLWGAPITGFGGLAARLVYLRRSTPAAT